METRNKTMRVWKLFQFVILTAVLTSEWGCSSDDDSDAVSYKKTTALQQPEWVIDLFSNDEPPSWTDPDLSQFENSMFLLIKLQPQLADYSTDDDRMACFIDNECRSVVAHRSVHDGDGSIYFAIKVLGNAIDRDITFELRYYSGGLHQLFSLSHTGSFIAEQTYGIDEDFEPEILAGSSKFPVHMNLYVSSDYLPFEVGEDDMVGVFINGECRGIGKADKVFYVLAYEEGEQAEIRYYSSLNNCIYTLKEKISLRENSAANAYEIRFK